MVSGELFCTQFRAWSIREKTAHPEHNGTHNAHARITQSRTTHARSRGRDAARHITHKFPNSVIARASIRSAAGYYGRKIQPGGGDKSALRRLDGPGRGSNQLSPPPKNTGGATAMGMVAKAAEASISPKPKEPVASTKVPKRS